MKICVSCSNSIPFTDSWNCAHCDYKPEYLGDFPAFAPPLAFENDGMPADSFEKLLRLESGSFWFCARNELIIWALKKFFSQPRNFLEIGCGTGFVLRAVAKALPTAHVVASEIYQQGLVFAKTRTSKVEFIQMDARHIPYRNEFHGIGAFDVLEHIEDDEAVLKEMHQALAGDKSRIILTVPQHQFLWSHADTYARHVRRYSAIDLVDKVERAGFDIVFITSFVSFLLPIMFLSRTLSSKDEKSYDPWNEFKIPPLINKILSVVMNVERSVIKLGVKLPFGGSILLIAQKKVDSLSA